MVVKAEGRVCKRRGLGLGETGSRVGKGVRVARRRRLLPAKRTTGGSTAGVMLTEGAVFRYVCNFLLGVSNFS